MLATYNALHILLVVQGSRGVVVLGWEKLRKEVIALHQHDAIVEPTVGQVLLIESLLRGHQAASGVGRELAAGDSFLGRLNAQQLLESIAVLGLNIDVNRGEVLVRHLGRLAAARSCCCGVRGRKPTVELRLRKSI